jgi:integrase/recombinase XerD
MSSKGAVGLLRAMRLKARPLALRGGALARPPAFERNAPDALASCADAWLEMLRGRRYSELTVRQHEADLRIFMAWAAERDVTRAGEVTRPILEAYQRWLSLCEATSGRNKGKRLGWGTLRHRLHVLRSFFRRLTRENVILHNPASELEMPRRERRLPVQAMTKEELSRLLAIPNIADPLGVRDRAMLEVFYATGIRRAELASLELTDVGAERGTLTVRHGKGGKDRVVPLGPRALGWIQHYLGETRPHLCGDARVMALFLTGYGEAFSPSVLSHAVTSWMRVAGLSGRGSCHLLRHTCATHMLEGGADVRYVQQLLGHESLDTTAIYTQVTINRLIEVHTRCHPSAQVENAASVAAEKLAV